MLTGEYAVLDGAKALALPTRFGQSMTVKKSRSSDLSWKSLDKNGDTWFEATISLYDFSAVKTTDDAIARKLGKLLKNACRLNSEFLGKWNGFKVETKLEFDRDWGLGSSSTLTHIVAEWADVHPLKLHWKVSDGSGYDVACSMAGAPIVFITNEDETSFTPVDFAPSYSDQLYFVHMGRKQDSAAAITHYFKKAKGRKKMAARISELTEAFLEADDVATVKDIFCEHNQLISASLGCAEPKEEHFSDFWGCIKPLGAWGGDFVMAVSEESPTDTKKYFSDKGLSTILSYGEIIAS